jgi:hypothetical protein
MAPTTGHPLAQLKQWRQRWKFSPQRSTTAWQNLLWVVVIVVHPFVVYISS